MPPIPGEAQDELMDAIETSRKRNAEDAGHETDDAGRGGVQPDPGTMTDDSMQEAMRDAGALGSDVAALAETYSQARFQQRAGAFGLSAFVAMDLRLGWDLGIEADQLKAQKTLSYEKPHVLILSPLCLAFSQLQTLNTKPDRLAELLEQEEASLGVCMRSGRIAGRAWWTRSLRASLGGDVVERAVPDKGVGDRWHAQGPMRSMSVRNDFG